MSNESTVEVKAEILKTGDKIIVYNKGNRGKSAVKIDRLLTFGNGALIKLWTKHSLDPQRLAPDQMVEVPSEILRPYG